MLDVNVILAKLETTYADGTTVPAAATDAFLVYDWVPKPQIFDEVRRKIERPFPGATPKLKTRGRQGHALKLELSGSGTAATPARWGSVWLRACMFDTPTTAAGEVTYPLTTSGDGGSLALANNKGNLRMRATGFRSTAKFVFNAGDVPGIEFDGLGLLPADPDVLALPVPTLPVYPAPIEVNTVNTSFTLGGFALNLRSFEADLRMKSEYRDLVGQRAIIFGKGDDGIQRVAGGRIVAELPDPAVKSYFADIRNRTNVALDLVHGLAAGNIVDLKSTVLNLDEMDFSVEQGRVMMSCTYDLVPTVAGNDFTLKTR